jgi:pimeloyl-ACP methyl ester carboxylesterase
MSIDHPFLRSLRSFEDPRLGLRELFVLPLFGGGRSVAVLSTPLADQRDTGWVVCHSFGMEQIYLQPLEVAVARRLASNGYPALRFHAQGYGDSDGPTEALSLASHLRDAAEAARLLVEATSVTKVGFIGGRFGGTVAALTADREGASRLVLWEPVVDGHRYVNQLLRAGVVADLASRNEIRSSQRDPLRALEEAGVIDVEGFPLHSSVVEEMSRVSLAEDLTAFCGDSLVLQISRGRAENVQLASLVSKLRRLGGRSSHEILLDRQARMFGLQRYQSADDGGKADTQEDLSRAVAVATLSWCVGEHLEERDAPGQERS